MKDGHNGVFDGDFAAFLAALQRRIGAAAFNSWMGDLRIENRGDDSVTMSTSSQFKRDMLAQRYFVSMRDSWTEVVGRPSRFDLVARKQELKDGAARVNALAPAPQPLHAPKPSAPALSSAARGGRAAPSLSDLASPVDERATFERFAVDETNRLAHAAARQLLSPGAPRDVVYVYGPSGVGKTHLLHAIANAWTLSQSGGDCAYLTYNNLKNGCVDAVFTNGLLALHRDLSAQGVVLIDDIHLLATSVRTQMEILNLLNASQTGGCRIVIAGEVSPAELTRMGMKDRLADRLAGGLCVSIQPGGESLRRDVLAKRVADLNCQVTPEAIDFIARNFNKSMREALGALSQLKLIYGESERPVGVEEAAAALRDRLADAGKRRPTLENLIDAAAQAFAVTPEDIKGRSQQQKYVRARHAYVLIARDTLKESYPRIAKAIGRDHTTIMSGYDRARALLTRCSVFQRAIAAIKAALGLA